MFCCATLAAPGAYGLDIGLVRLNLGAISTRRQLHERVKRHRHPRAFLLRLLHKICVDAADDGLVRDDEDIFASFQFHDDWFQADYDISVALTAAVAVIVFVCVPCLEIFRVQVGNLLVSHAVADASVQLIQRFPLQLVVVFW